MSEIKTTVTQGVKPRDPNGALIFADGRVERGPSFKYDNAAPHKRLNRDKQKVIEEPIEEENISPEEAPVSRETQPKQIKYSPEDAADWFEAAGWAWSGVRVAGNLTRGTAWRIPSVDGRYLYLVNKEDWEEGIQIFISKRLSGDIALSEIYPAEMGNLLEDPQIGPILSFMSPQMPMANEEKDHIRQKTP